MNERKRERERERERETAFYRPAVLSRLDGDSERASEARPSLRGGKSRRSAATAHLLAHVSMPNMYVSTCEQKLEPNGDVSVFVHAHLLREWCYACKEISTMKTVVSYSSAYCYIRVKNKIKDSFG